MTRAMKPFIILLAGSLFFGCHSPSPGATPGSRLETVFIDSSYQLTGIAVSKTGRLFVTYPRWSSAYRYGLVEIRKGKPVPFPDSAYNSWKPQDSGLNKWICAMAVTIDDQNHLWVVDPASPRFSGVVKNGQKLVRINLRNDSVEQTFPLANTT